MKLGVSDPMASAQPAARNDVIVLHGMQHWTNAWWPWKMSKNYYAQLTKCWQVGLAAFCHGKILIWRHTHRFSSKHDTLGYSGMKSGLGSGDNPRLFFFQMFHLGILAMLSVFTVLGFCSWLGMDMLNTITVLNKLSRLKGASILGFPRFMAV